MFRLSRFWMVGMVVGMLLFATTSLYFYTQPQGYFTIVPAAVSDALASNEQPNPQELATTSSPKPQELVTSPPKPQESATTSPLKPKELATTSPPKPLEEPLEDPVFGAEYVKRRRTAMNACMGSVGNKTVEGGIVYISRYGIMSDGRTPWCGRNMSEPIPTGSSTTSTSSSSSTSYPTSETIVTPYGMTSYCGTPKLACTFWLSVFRFLCNDTGTSRFDSPLDMTIADIHYQNYRMKFYSKPDLKYMSDDFRFMFTREPYSRLWSAYVDKIYLPDFWVRAVNMMEYSLKHKKRLKHNSCANDVTFGEFLDFLAETDPGEMNTHWRPVHLQCSPCLFRPHVIGKLETFSKDARVILKHLNASWVLEDYDQNAHVHSEVEKLTDFNFEIIGRENWEHCSNGTDIARRLWNAFQYNGYIPIEAPFPFTNISGHNLNSTHFKRAAFSAVDAGKTKSKVEWRKQRKAAMVAAYRTVSMETLLNIKQKYWMDFVMFDYNPEPTWLFEGREAELISLR